MPGSVQRLSGPPGSNSAGGAEHTAADEVTLGRAFEGRRLFDV
ncbi:hypothetical protein [Streptantibioticus ferralitis]